MTDERFNLRQSWLSSSEEYGALVRALRRKRGFGLFFVQASPAKGAEILAGLQEELSGKRFAVVKLDRQNEDLFGPVAAVWGDDEDERPDVVWVEGVEQSLLGYEDVKRLAGQERDLSHYSRTDLPPLLRGLNLGRERFAKQFPCAVVMVVPLFVVRYFLRRAGDFFDWKSGFFEFPDENPFGEVRAFLADAEFEVYKELDSAERTKRILEAEACLESGTLNEDEKAKLYREVGRLFISEENHESALLNFDKAINIKPDYYYAWNNRGNSLRNLARYEEAIASYDKALEIKPNYHYAWSNRGNSLANLGRYEEAIASYDKALEFKPDNHNLWCIRGLLQTIPGRNEEAIASYDKAIELKPDFHEAWTNRGNSLDALGRREEAIASYDKAIEYKPDFHEAWTNRGNSLDALGRREEAIASYDKAIELKPDYHEAWSNRGVSLDALGRREEAIASYEKAIEYKPDKHGAWNNRGVSLAALGRREEAIASWEKAIDYKPDLHEAWYNRGVSLAALGRREEAIASYDKAIEYKPDYHEAWNNRGNSLAALGRREEAIASYDKALEIKPDYHYSWKNRGSSLYSLGRYEEAIASYKKALEIKPDDSTAHEKLGILYYEQGQTQKAYEQLEKLIEIQPEEASNWNNAGYLLLVEEVYRTTPIFEKPLAIRPSISPLSPTSESSQALQDRYQQALNYFNQATTLDPEMALAWGNRSYPLYRLGDLDAALESCDRALQLGLTDEVNHSNRGTILLQLHRITEAQTSFEAALAVKADHPDAHYGLARTYALQNQPDLALEHLHQAIQLNPEENRSPAQIDSDFDSLRQDPRFQQLLAPEG